MSRLQDVLIRGLRADQPLATTVSPGTVYVVLDEGFIQEQAVHVGTTATWEQFSPSPAGAGGINELVGDVLAGPASGVATASIAPNAVTAPQIAANAVTTAKLLDANVTGPKLADGAVTGPKLADGAVTATKVPDASIANAKLADMAAATVKGRAAGAGTGVPTDLTSAEITAIADLFAGDSGAGGTKGLVPAPAAGDAAAGKFLKADSSWDVPPGGGGGGGAGASFSGAKVFNSAAQSIPLNASTVVAANSERYDTHSYHDTVTNNSRLTVSETGYYLVQATGTWAGSSTGYRILDLRANGSSFFAAQTCDPDAADPVYMATGNTIFLTAGQYVEVMAFSASATVDFTLSSFTITRLGTDVPSSGALIGVRVLTPGAGTYTPTVGTSSVVIQGQGGGGGGSGVAQAAASQVNIGGGGAGGGYFLKRLTANFSGAAYVVGAKGTGGAAGNNAGVAGGATTFSPTGGGAVLTAGGGGGGIQNGSLAPPWYSQVLATPGSATNGDINVGGGHGSIGYATNIQTGFGAAGGASMFSSGGAMTRMATGTGQTPVSAPGYGGGGAGASSSNNAGGSKVGGDGSDGLLLIWEYGAATTSDGLIPLGTMEGRLTTESGVPVSSADRTAQSTIYFTPYNGNRVALYTGVAWQLMAVPELSLALAGLTVGANYDVFLNYNAGTPQLALSAAWATNTTRTNALASQDGVLVKSGTPTQRYIGTIRTTSATATEDSVTKRFVWNLYNRVGRMLRRRADVTHSYTSTTFRYWNNDPVNQLECVTGIPGLSMLATLGGAMHSATEHSTAASIALELNWVSGGPVLPQVQTNSITFSTKSGPFAFVTSVIGFNYIAIIQSTSGNATYYNVAAVAQIEG